MENERGATTNFTGSSAATPPWNSTQQLRRGAGSRLTNLTGTLAGRVRTTPRCQGLLGPAVTRDSGPTGAGMPANRGMIGVALAVTPASLVALAVTPALVAALAATPAATIGSGEATKPLYFSKPLFLYIYTLLFSTPPCMVICPLPPLLFPVK